MKLIIYEVWMKLKARFETSFGATLERPAILVRAVDEGVEGWGEVVAGEGPWYSYETYQTAWHVIKDYIAPLMAKRRAYTPHSFIEAVSPMRGHNMAKAGVEHALWDLEARKRGIPLWRLLGGVKDRIESGVSIGIQPSIENLIETVNRYLDEGYRRIKIKIKPGWDIDPVSAIRREIGDVPLQVDANAAYTLAHINTFKMLDKFDLLMIEQPLHYDDLLDHSTLAKLLKTPICLDESIKSPKHALDAYKLDSAQIINVKPGRLGGHLESIKVHRIWHEDAGRPLWVGGMLETGIGRGHLVALATLPGFMYPNDISGSSRYYEEDIVEPEWVVKDGFIEAPNRPGIGVEPRVDVIERIARRRVEFEV